MTNFSAAQCLCLCMSSSTSAAPVFLLSCAIFATIKVLIAQMKSYPDFYPNFILRHPLSFKTSDFQWRTLTCFFFLFFLMSLHCRLALIVSNSHGDLRQMHQHSKGNVRGCRRDGSPASLNLNQPAWVFTSSSCVLWWMLVVCVLQTFHCTAEVVW